MHSTPPRPSGARRVLGTRRRWGLLALALTPVLLSGCTVPNFGAYKSSTTTGRSTFHLWQGFSIAAIIIGGFTLLLIIWAALRYRARANDDSLPRQTQYHLPLEITYTVVPILIVFALFAATVVVENKVTALPAPSATINVLAKQWGWKFTYPGYNFSIIGQSTQVPTMVMPQNENVRIYLRSGDVVHGFYVRKFNFSRYALPGVINAFTLNAQVLGTYFGQCTQLCGLYHSLMFFKVKVVTPADYQVWLLQQQAAAQRHASTPSSETEPTSPGVGP